MYHIGIIGGETHIEEVTRLRGAQLEIVGVLVRPDQASHAQHMFGATVFTDLHSFLQHTPMDVVAVANENDLRAKVILEALRHGKHVIVDKPMALTLGEVEEIERVAFTHDLRVLMLLTLRGNPWYRKVHEIVASGSIGEPVQVYGKMSVPLLADQRPPWFLDSRRSGGPILDLAIHTFDQIEWVTGLKLTRVWAHEATISHPEMVGLIDSGAELFLMENGGTALVEQNRVGLEYDYRFNVIGTHGQVNLHFNRSLRVQTDQGWSEIGAEELGEPCSVVGDWLRSLDGDGIALVPDQASFRASKLACWAKQAAVNQSAVTLA